MDSQGVLASAKDTVLCYCTSWAGIGANDRLISEGGPTQNGEFSPVFRREKPRDIGPFFYSQRALVLFWSTSPNWD